MPYCGSDSESEPEQLRNVSEFELLSGSDEEESIVLDALAFSYVRGRGHAVVWDGRIEQVSSSSSDDDLPGRARDEDAPEPLGHPSLGSDPHREGSKSQNL